MKLSTLILRNIRRNPKVLGFSTVGIVLGIGVFLFFASLGAGLQENVLQRIFVADQLEVVPRRIELGTELGIIRIGRGHGPTRSAAPATVQALVGPRERH